ncbi:MAG: hypothetical protein ACRDSS_01025, partial [Actinocrinis sp.]
MNIRITALTTAAGLALAAGALGMAGTASAAPAPVTYQAAIGKIPVTVSANDGGSAVVNAGGTISLTVGTPAATAYAQAVLTLPAGSVLPATAPAFTSDHFAAGSPRWVIELANGDQVFGNQSGTSQSGDPAAADWTDVNLVSGKSVITPATGTYAAVLARESGQVVKSAYVVEDGDQAAGAVDVISAVQYDGQKLTVRPVTAAGPYVSGGHVVTVSGTRASASWTESADNGPWLENSNPPAGGKCEEVWISGYGFGTWNPADPADPGTAHIGFTCDHGTGNVNTGDLWGLTPG